MEKEKEEAERIIEMFQPFNQEHQEGTDGFYSDDKEGAIQCALLHVQGLIDTSLHIFKMYKVGASEIGYYQKVKQIIESK